MTEGNDPEDPTLPINWICPLVREPRNEEGDRTIAEWNAKILSWVNQGYQNLANFDDEE